MPAGRDKAGDAVLDPGGHPAAGEAGDGPGLRAARLHDHGEEPQERRGRQDVSETRRGGREQARAHRATREYVFYKRGSLEYREARVV